MYTLHTVEPTYAELFRENKPRPPGVELPFRFLFCEIVIECG